MLVFVHMSKVILTVLCFNDVFQIFARGFIWQGHVQDITLNVSFCAHFYWIINMFMFQ